MDKEFQQNGQEKLEKEKNLEKQGKQESEFGIKTSSDSGNQMLGRQSMLFFKLFSKMYQNQSLINQITSSIEQNYQKLKKCSGSTEQAPLKQIIKIQQQINSYQPKKIFLQTKLFGKRDYLYNLYIEHNIVDNILYKERNFNISVKLVDKDNNRVRNYNVLQICLAVCTNDGKWITETKNGEKMLKGQTEVQFYEGQAVFNKIYLRDISKQYPQRKINLVIYCKPSVLVYPGNTLYNEHVNSEDIRPEILDNIVVKSKKK